MDRKSPVVNFGPGSGEIEIEPNRCSEAEFRNGLGDRVYCRCRPFLRASSAVLQSQSSWRLLWFLYDRLWSIASVTWKEGLRLRVIVAVVGINGRCWLVTGLLKCLSDSGQNSTGHYLPFAFVARRIYPINLQPGSHRLQDSSSNLLRAGSACIRAIVGVAHIVIATVVVPYMT